MKLKKNILNMIIALLFAALTGLLLLQLYFLKNAYDQKEQTFKNNVIDAMNKTAASLEMLEAAKNLIVEAAENQAKKQKGLAKFQGGRNVKQFNADAITKHMMFFNYSTDGGIGELHKPIKVIIGVTKSPNIACGPKSYSNFIYNGVNSSYQLELPDSSMASFVVSSSDDSNLIRLSSTYGVTLTGRDSMEINRVVKKGKTNIVAKVVDRLLMVKDKPIEQRIAVREMDSLIKHNLADGGITLPYAYGIKPAGKDSVTLSNVNGSKDDLAASDFRVRLFASELLAPANTLLLDFPGRKMFLFRELMPQLILSVVFILIIAFSFSYTLATIFRQMRFSRQVKDFINNMTHEFKTPISTISLASEAIANPLVLEKEHKLKKYNSIIGDEIARMKTQVEKILQMAVIEEGDYVIEKKPVSLNDIVTKVMQSYSLRIEACGGKSSIKLNLPEPIITGDQMHITNIINNLVDNAIKYSPDKPEISVSTEKTPDNIIVRIVDNGIGIPKEHLNKVFEKYYRVFTGNTHDIKGFGIGLSYVKLMIEAHGGSIKIESKPGKGTTVILRFPPAVTDAV